MTIKHFNTFYILAENEHDAKKLMTDFVLGKDCPSCLGNQGRNEIGWACECITFNDITLDDFEEE